AVPLPAELGPQHENAAVVPSRCIVRKPVSRHEESRKQPLRVAGTKEVRFSCTRYAQRPEMNRSRTARTETYAFRYGNALASMLEVDSCRIHGGADVSKGPLSS